MSGYTGRGFSTSALNSTQQLLAKMAEKLEILCPWDGELNGEEEQRFVALVLALDLASKGWLEDVEAARAAERKRAIAAIQWVFSADGTKAERSLADEAVNKINDPMFVPRGAK